MICVKNIPCKLFARFTALFCLGVFFCLVDFGVGTLFFEFISNFFGVVVFNVGFTAVVFREMQKDGRGMADLKAGDLLKKIKLKILNIVQ